MSLEIIQDKFIPSSEGSCLRKLDLATQFDEAGSQGEVKVWWLQLQLQGRRHNWSHVATQQPDANGINKTTIWKSNLILHKDLPPSSALTKV
jgi:hypothetical protein